ncbi:probable vesicular glutamate transporter eat-4 [Uloborus diversus]|uniref:probable vesicular glutamate transporter eat-4 n=1 Tax=Uloborus diversus TaxID=327109 RepID=UPI00240A3CE7|nr:probable vesicular glutamate transporter eat-4 [Uloborus diversus]
MVEPINRQYRLMSASIYRVRPAVPWKKILSSTPTHALMINAFGQHWTAYYFIELHATFLKTILHYPMAKIGTLISMPYVLTMIVTVATAFLSTKAENLFSVNKVRKFWNLITSVIWSMCFALMIFTNYGNTATVFSSIIGIGSIGFMNHGIMIVPIEMTPIFAGSLSGLTAAISSLAGCILPVVCGVLTKEEVKFYF